MDYLSGRPEPLFLKLFTDGEQFLPTFCIRLGIAHRKFVQRIEDNFGYDQPAVALVVGGNDTAASVESQYFRGSFSPSGHSMRNHSSGRGSAKL